MDYCYIIFFIIYLNVFLINKDGLIFLFVINDFIKNITDLLKPFTDLTVFIINKLFFFNT
jgi:hypothetical protein